MSGLLLRATRVPRAVRGGRIPIRSVAPARWTRALSVTPVAATSGATSAVSESIFAPLDTFPRRHVGPQTDSIEKMLSTLGYDSLESFVDACVPPAIRLPDDAVASTAGPLPIAALSEQELLARAKEVTDRNQVTRSFIGMGYYQAVIPPVILRNVLENHGWFSQYSPYQAEISQGRLESLINFQTLTTSLTGLAFANASLLDEGTAAAEAMFMAYGNAKHKRHTFYVDQGVLPQTLAVVRQRAQAFNIRVVVGKVSELVSSMDDVFGVLVQYPDTDGDILSWRAVADTVHASGGLVACATDLLALTVLEPPGEWGADIALGNSARFGVPLGFGGPHAAFFACTDALKRRMPGRIIGLSRDAEGRPAYRLALQTREQHIRREKATSNICTAQALLANLAAMYAVYHGPTGLRRIAEKVHGLTRVFAAALERLGGVTLRNKVYFDTLTLRLDGFGAQLVHAAAAARGVNLRRIDDANVGVAFDESTTAADVLDLIAIFEEAKGRRSNRSNVRVRSVPHSLAELEALAREVGVAIETPLAATDFSGLVASPLASFARTTPFLTQPVFNAHHSETDILRYIHRLQDKDLSLVHAMIPLGSCTMKLNATASMIPLTWDTVARLHPFAPAEQAAGYAAIFDELARDLSALTGLPGCSLQPNSGAQGEYAGLSVIRAYHASRGDSQRDVCLIPVSAHGTNPASAMLAGLRVVPVAVLENGTLDLADLRAKAEKHKDNLAAFMVTYPSTYGVFENGIREAIDVIHAAGGQVYLDGANMNAMIGLTSPGHVGADVCHLNLHKTFGIPHGGGGPGQGPICCAAHLTPFLPGHPAANGPETAIGPVSAAPHGSASILTISWAFIKLLGGDGLKFSSQVALLNANYAMEQLKDAYRVKFVNENGRCAHEFILDLAEFDSSTGLKVMDFAKRLQDFGIHPPTCSWPLSTAMLIEPTESEGLRDLDGFVQAMLAIRREADAIAAGEQPRDNNIIKNAPHSIHALTQETWDRPYTRQQAAYPLERLKSVKFWPSVGRVDDSYGDRNLVCECGTVEEYA